MRSLELDALVARERYADLLRAAEHRRLLATLPPQPSRLRFRFTFTNRSGARNRRTARAAHGAAPTSVPVPCC